jgi:HEAT repeat protein
MLSFLPFPLLLFVLLALTVGALVFLRQKRKAERGFDNVKPLAGVEDTESGPERRAGQRRLHPDRRTNTDSSSTIGSLAPLEPSKSLTLAARSQGVATDAALFGAYRVEQEVGKLILGQPCRSDVLASRAPDDRRAIEASLLKALAAPWADEDSRRRVRTALEEYGFVARQSAALLLANSAHDRCSAARVLGDIGSAAALPFLLEALYDNEEIVRIHAVIGLGGLRLPSAIGALLDMARRYPQMPAELISSALSACSVDCMDTGALGSWDLELLEMGTAGAELTALEDPRAVEPLPISSSEPNFLEILRQLTSDDHATASNAARSLGEYRVAEAISALTEVLGNSAATALRAAAVTALGSLDHETVFVPIIIAMADDAREVRAAAARALSSLGIDRAEAFARVAIQMDPASKKSVAAACLKSGMAKQAIDRLGSADRRQAYEAFATLAVLASAGETDLLIDAIGQHPNESISAVAARVLGAFPAADLVPALRQVAVSNGISEARRTVVLELLYNIDQGQFA